MPATPDLPADLVGTEPAIANELDDAMIATVLDADAAPYILPEDNERRDRVRAWVPQTLDEAEWAMRKLAALRARQADIAQQAAVWTARIGLWQADEERRVAPGVAFFTDRLTQFGLAVRQADERRKSVALPSGTIKTRASQAKVVVADEDAVLTWAESLPAEERARIVKTKASIRLTELREVVAVSEHPGGGFTTFTAVHTATGEIVPGLAVEIGDTTATVEIER